MTQEPVLHQDSTSVQTHLNIMQGVIQRMAENSRACKFWCVTIVSATLVLVARTERPEYALIALVPAALFLILDAYYLALERRFRSSYSKFLDELHRSELTPSDLFRVQPRDGAFSTFASSLTVILHLAVLLHPPGHGIAGVVHVVPLTANATAT